MPSEEEFPQPMSLQEELLKSILNELSNIRRECATSRQLLSDFVNAMRDAEKEIPESMRRFMNYFHDVRDIRYMHEEHGTTSPVWIDREIERLYDRYRQLLDKMHTDGGAFEKIRREMAADPENRYDHTRLLSRPSKETNGEAGKSE